MYLLILNKEQNFRRIIVKNKLIFITKNTIEILNFSYIYILLVFNIITNLALMLFIAILFLALSILL